MYVLPYQRKYIYIYTSIRIWINNRQEIKVQQLKIPALYRWWPHTNARWNIETHTVIKCNRSVHLYFLCSSANTIWRTGSFLKTDRLAMFCAQSSQSSAMKAACSRSDLISCINIAVTHCMGDAQALKQFEILYHSMQYDIVLQFCQYICFQWK